MIGRLLHKLFGCGLFWNYRFLFDVDEFFLDGVNSRTCTICGKHQTWNEIHEEWLK